MEDKNSKTVVIAEIGVNHNGDLHLAEQLMRVARDCGADYAKFQTFRTDELTTPGAALASYQEKTGIQSQADLLRNLELSEKDFAHLKDLSADIGIGFLSTGHDFESALFLRQLDLDFVKIPSGDLTNLPFLEFAASEGKPVLLSTGMGTLDEVRQALNVLFSAGLPRTEVTVLQCTTNYPAPPGETNLRAMVTMGKEFSVNVGFSDHTSGIEASLAAVALGASVIEKHLTLDKKLPGPDHSASADPEEFRHMVEGIRRVEQMLGLEFKAPTASEYANRGIVRKSIVATKRIEAGERLSTDNVGVKRPGDGLSPMKWHEVMGSKASRDYAPDDRIELS